jgi:GT2 family glycosyltransferase
MQIVVVDNNSKDNSVSVLTHSSLPFTLIQNKRNLGWAEGHNVGIRHALKNGADEVFIFANDATLQQKTIEQLSRLMQEG